MRLKNAIEYLQEHPNGKIDLLLEKVGKETLEEIELVGIIHRGKEHDGVSSYKFTPTGREIYAFMEHDKEYKPTFSENPQAFVSKII